MSAGDNVADAIVIGGGFYGAALACYMATERGLANVWLLEREDAVMKRASFSNQARVHNGYHYPRSFTTAYRSRVNLPRFIDDWQPAVETGFTKLYAIARRNSKVTASQFARFCRSIGASLETPPPSIRKLFNDRLIEDVFVTQEYAFDATRLARLAQAKLEQSGVRLSFDSEVEQITRGEGGDRLQVLVRDRRNGALRALTSRHVFNCTYSGMNRIGGQFPGTSASLKHEITEMALLQLPPGLSGLGITVMDGPFFSLMPFPPRQLHTLSHVRYTPHVQWLDNRNADAYQRMQTYPQVSRADRMVRDAARYLPSICDARHVESLFEVKTVLARSEADDGRPILFERHADLPGCVSILGGKIDNIYDVLEHLDAYDFTSLE